MIVIKINGKKIKARQGQTVLEVALENGIDIAHLCWHPDLEAKADCRLCLVSVKGCPLPQTACATLVKDGMEVITETAELEKLRKTNLELIFSQHKEECEDCVWDYNCELLKLAKKYNVKMTRFADRKTNFPAFALGATAGEAILQFDSSKCVDCRNCVDICAKQQVNHLKIIKKDNLQQVVPNDENPCVFCGQCLIHCPAGAFESESEFEQIEKPFKDKSKTIIFQFAPSIRTAIGEEFGLPPGVDLTGQITAGLKQLGANYVFDTSCGADFTTFEEAKEAVERLNKKENLPIFSSCCPSWVRFIEIYHPNLIPHLASTRPPHIILGGLVKTYWAKQKKIDRENIIVISVMPCIAKKYEITRQEFFIDGKPPVDYVLTTRELARLFKKQGIDLTKIEPIALDNPFGEFSGAGVIYGASGGVMEAVLRTKQKLQKCKAPSALQTIAVSGLDKAEKILQELEQNPNGYTCVEVMACWDGCVGGGGQPLPTTPAIRQARAEGLRQIDKNKKLKLAHENPTLKKIYEEFLTNEEIINKICHTKYANKSFSA